MKFLSISIWPGPNLWRKVLLLGTITLLMPSLPPALLAQNRPVKFERLSVAEGLSQSSGLCILQDRQGFLWFGTQDGLNKYDGYGVTIYQQNVPD